MPGTTSRLVLVPVSEEKAAVPQEAELRCQVTMKKVPQIVTEALRKVFRKSVA